MGHPTTNGNFSSLSIYRFLFSGTKSEPTVSGFSRSKRTWVFDFLDQKPAMVTYFSLLFNVLKKGAFILRRNNFLFIFKFLRDIHRSLHWTLVEWDEHTNSQIPNLSYFTLSPPSPHVPVIQQLLTWPRSCHGHLYHSCFPTPLHLENLSIQVILNLSKPSRFPCTLITHHLALASIIFYHGPTVICSTPLLSPLLLCNTPYTPSKCFSFKCGLWPTIIRNTWSVYLNTVSWITS